MREVGGREKRHCLLVKSEWDFSFPHNVFWEDKIIALNMLLASPLDIKDITVLGGRSVIFMCSPSVGTVPL